MGADVKATQIWLVQYTSVHQVRRTSVFTAEVNARRFYDYCIDSEPTLWVSDTTFTQVQV
jgi:hypothetical protein